MNTDLIYVISPANIQRIGRITIVLNQKSSTDADEDAATARDGVSYGAGGAATARHAHETAEHDHECESELYQYAYVYMQDYMGNYLVASAKYAEPSVESLRHRQLRLRATGAFPTAEPGKESSMYLEHWLLE